MKKVVLKLELHNDKDKQKAMKKVSGLSGVESIAMDMKEKKLTVTGDIDAVTVVGKLRKLCHTELITVGPAKEPEKKKEEPPKKDDAKKNEAKKDSKNDVVNYQPLYNHHQYPYYHQYPPPPPMPAYYHHYPPPPPSSMPAYYAKSVEEDPNTCVIC